MKTLKNNNSRSQQSTAKCQSVAMIVYFDGDSFESRSYWANYDLDFINEVNQRTGELTKLYPDFKEGLYNLIVEETYCPEQDHVFYNLCMSYMVLDQDIQEKIREYPDGGYGIIGYYNYDDQSDQKYQFLNPKEFQKHLSDDFTVIPFNRKNVGITIDEDRIICDDLDEGMFLSCLTELIRISENSSCHYSNEELLRRIPEHLRDLNWISRSLGKFESLGLIEILTYDVNGTVWYRDINQTHPAEHILFAMENNQSA